MQDVVTIATFPSPITVERLLSMVKPVARDYDEVAGALLLESHDGGFALRWHRDPPTSVP